MDKFEQWFKTYRPSLDTSAIEAEFIFEAGQQSRQAEVADKDQRIHELNETSLDLEGQIYKLQEQLNEKDKRIEELELALTKIKSWESHPKNYETDFGSWGLRDFYRDLADKALRGKDQYTEHRTKAEQQINNGARLTNHQIDL